MGFISPLAILQVSAKIVDSKILFNKEVSFFHRISNKQEPFLHSQTLCFLNKGGTSKESCYQNMV